MNELAKKAINEYQREWRAKNKEKVNAYNKAWREANKDKVKQYNENYWTKKAQKGADNE